MEWTTRIQRYSRREYLWLLLALPLAAGTVRIYVTNSAGDNVHVIDPATNQVVHEFREIGRASCRERV